MSTNGLIARLTDLSTLGRHSGGIDRALATPQERAARERFASWARDAGYVVAQDRVGNVFARRAGTRRDLAPILIGSHLDTVSSGGPYDGAYGVVAALCALESLDESGISTAHPLEAVAWVGEEGGRFPLGCLGSSVFAGVCDIQAALALKDADGITLGDALASPAGGLLTNVGEREPLRTAAYLELHVEQGPVLEREGAHLGVVTAIAGQQRYQIAVYGESGHAGTVPMHLRADALSAAAELILAIEAAARAENDAVATVGRLQVEPGGMNVIPGRVVFSLDVRAEDGGSLSSIVAALERESDRVSRERDVRTKIELLESRLPAPMDVRMRAALHRSITSLNERAIDIASFAGHDARCLSSIAPAAMLFVPSIGGRSHVPDEQTAGADLELGVNALTAAIVEVDRMLELNSAVGMRFFICGSALRGQPDHKNLGDAKFLGEVRTAPRYRLHSVRDEHPGIYEVESGGVSIAGELYEFTPEQHRHLLETEPPDLYESPIVLEDGSRVSAMIYPRALVKERGYEDVSQYGGWAAFKSARGST